MKLLPKIRKQFLPLSKTLPPVGSIALFLVSNELDGDEFVVAEVERAVYLTQIKTATGHYSTESTTPKRGSWPYVKLATGTRDTVTSGKYLIVAQ